MRVWPALPRLGELVRLPLPCPPQLVELSGYTGGARLIALWWSPFGDELMICDGTVTETAAGAGGCASVGTRWRVCSWSPTGWATQRMRASIGCSSTAIWERWMSGSRATSSSCWPRSPRSFTR